MARLSLLLLATSACTLATSCSLTKGSWVSVDMTYGGRTRTSIVRIPSSGASTSTPLVMGLHYWGGTSENMKSYWGTTLSESEKFSFVFPQGVGNTWNAGVIGGDAKTYAIDDVGYLKALVAKIVSLGCADESRVYAWGVSNGAFMTYRLACQAGSVFAAFAPVSGLMGDKSTTPATTYFTCSPSRVLPILSFHGTSDTTIYYTGEVFSSSTICRSESAAFEYWSTADGCSSSSSKTSLTQGVMTCKTSGCTATNANVTLCTITGGTHSTWPTNGAYHIWTFFKKYSLSSSSSSTCSLSSLPTGASGWGTCSTSVSAGSTCAFTCSSSYTAVTGKCSSSGSWTTSPSCAASTCSLTLPSNASGWGTCSSSVSSGSSCAFSCPSGKTATSGYCYAGSWVTTPACTSSGCVVNKTCGTQVCGSFWNGCATVSCGTCSSGTCNGKTCVSTASSSSDGSSTTVTLDSIDEWEQTYPDSYTTLNWGISGNALVMTNYTLSTTPRFVKYTGVQTSWFSSSYTAVTVLIKATEGTVNVGLRLGQTTSVFDRIGWKLEISSGVANTYYCRTYKGPPETCVSGATSQTFSTTSTNNLTMYFSVGSTYINTKAWLNSKVLVSSEISETASHFPSTGSLFIVTKGSAKKTFSQLVVRSKTAVHVVLQQCMTTSAWNSFVANLLGISASSVSSRIVGQDAACSSRKRSLDPTSTMFEMMISDDLETSTPSSALMEVLQNAIADGAATWSGIDVITLEATVPELSVGTLVPVASAGLSAAAIGGISAGAAAGGLLLCGTAATAAVIVAKRKSGEQKATAEAQPQRKSIIRSLFGKSGGVDVMGNTTPYHSSITARGVPVPVDLPPVGQQ